MRPSHLPKNVQLYTTYCVAHLLNLPEDEILARASAERWSTPGEWFLDTGSDNYITDMLIRKFYVLEALPADLAMAICLREIVLCSAAIVSLNAKTTKKQQRMAHYSSELRLLKRLNKKGLV